MTTTPTAAAAACPACGASVPPRARFCESCGAGLDQAAGGAASPTTPDAAEDSHEIAPISAPTRRPSGALPDPQVQAGAVDRCADCGATVGPDGYCTECGAKAPSPRDHFREQPASWVAGVCDKGVGKAGNEDAMALLAGREPGSRAVLIVLDGVSNSLHSAKASLAGAKAARDVLRLPLPTGLGTPAGREAAVTKVLTTAVSAANNAIVAGTDPGSPNPASATIVFAVLEGRRIHYAGVGDSRAYWLPDTEPGVQLTVDDSLAQDQIAAGVPRQDAEASPQAHAITKWLGRDAEDIAPRIGHLDVTAAGWLLVCSDGLWNYASEPAALQRQIAASGTTDPAELALALVGFANAAGGHDNITVALARVKAELDG
ncbi:PP2C family protein-serine/threonine phosphatase [Nocardioides sp.]|uniref:PP2C family protein-serine/threonine phosphatase n=1 Tax=Nocardioides sp. TaxID=35761 RepID=UPI0039E31079